MRDIAPLAIRMPGDLKATLEAAALRNHRSLNAELVARLESSLRPLKDYLTAELIAELVDRGVIEVHKKPPAP